MGSTAIAMFSSFDQSKKKENTSEKKNTKKYCKHFLGRVMRRFERKTQNKTSMLWCDWLFIMRECESVMFRRLWALCVLYGEGGNKSI